MKKTFVTIPLLAALAAGALAAAATPAAAAEGCGRGFHRGPAGRCRPNGPPVRRGPVIGTYYPGQGYYYNGRYWHQRYRDHGNWRYR